MLDQLLAPPTPAETSGRRPSRRAKVEGEKNRAMIVKTLKGGDFDDEALLEDDEEEEDEAMYITGDVSTLY